ncbi:MAG: hypothetical protein PVJ74_13070 [Gammaproteobacteria bacterium]
MRHNTSKMRPLHMQIAISLLSLALVGCVAHRPIENTYEQITAELEPGDRVKIELKDGQNLSFRVTEIRETEVVGRTGTDITRGEIVSVQYSDIDRLQRVDDRPGLYFGSIFGAFFLLIAVTWGM